MNIYRNVWDYVTEEELGQTQLFAGISPMALRKIIICSRAYIISYKRGEYSFREGDEPQNLYVLLSGNVLILKDYIHGRRNVFFETHEKECYGILIDHHEGERYWYDTLVMADSIALAIPWSFIFEFCSHVCIDHQTLLKNMVSVQADTCVYQMKKLHILSGVTLEAKIALLMAELADEQGYVDFKMNREELAAYLGVSRPSLSRSLMLMREQGLIEVHRSRARILDADGLKGLWQK